MDISYVLKRPLVTEKSTLLQDSRRYVFEVASAANKMEIKKAVEASFGVDVLRVNTMNVNGKLKRYGPKESRMNFWAALIRSRRMETMQDS